MAGYAANSVSGATLNRVCKKIVWIKAKLLFYTVCPKSAVRGGKNKYFQKILSEMNSIHPFYPILIPKTPCDIFIFNHFFCKGVPGGHKTLKNYSTDMLTSYGHVTSVRTYRVVLSAAFCSQKRYQCTIYSG